MSTTGPLATGTGRGATTNDDNRLMWLARLQWNAIGEPLGFTGSDLDHHRHPSALLAIAATTNRSPFTRFSSSGGGELETYPPGERGQYRTEQAMVETAGMWRGFSWQQELHLKRIEDRVNDETTTLWGNLVQAGYVIRSFPLAPLEPAFQFAFYTPNDALDAFSYAYTGAINWFFDGHHNKLTADATWFRTDDPVAGEQTEFRARLQWDISL